mmetsp:Transcript_63220/g.175949  ORF Transcript_63220/g.175949 Transcript_63220/m.175949 type:complete len:208 (+) Transcript_63220:172-795(+)
MRQRMHSGGHFPRRRELDFQIRMPRMLCINFAAKNAISVDVALDASHLQSAIAHVAYHVPSSIFLHDLNPIGTQVGRSRRGARKELWSFLHSPLWSCDIVEPGVFQTPPSVQKFLFLGRELRGQKTIALRRQALQRVVREFKAFRPFRFFRKPDEQFRGHFSLCKRPGLVRANDLRGAKIIYGGLARDHGLFPCHQRRTDPEHHHDH